MPSAPSLVHRIAWLLALAGAIALAALVALSFSGETRIRIPAIAALVTGCAVILSFLGGIEWGLALHEDYGPGRERLRALALGVSTLPALAAWGVPWLPSTQWQLGGFLALFTAVWLTDLWLARRGLVPSWFVDLRTSVTIAVAALLGVALYRL